jgi:hypothetical protein
MGATDGNVFDPQVGHGAQRSAPPSSDASPH